MSLCSRHSVAEWAADRGLGEGGAKGVPELQGAWAGPCLRAGAGSRQAAVRVQSRVLGGKVPGERARGTQGMDRI